MNSKVLIDFFSWNIIEQQSWLSNQLLQSKIDRGRKQLEHSSHCWFIVRYSRLCCDSSKTKIGSWQHSNLQVIAIQSVVCRYIFIWCASELLDLLCASLVSSQPLLMDREISMLQLYINCRAASENTTMHFQKLHCDDVVCRRIFCHVKSRRRLPTKINVNF